MIILNLHISSLDYDEMVATMQRLQINFKKHGMHALASRLNIAQNLLLKSVVAKALDTRVQLLQRRFPRVHNPISYNAQKLTKDVSFLQVSYQQSLKTFSYFSVLKHCRNRILLSPLSFATF